MNGVVIVISLPTLRPSSLPISFFFVAQKTGKNAGILLKKQAKIHTSRTFRGISILQKSYEP